MTTPPQLAAPGRHRRGTMPVTVTSAQASSGAPLINGPARLMGWSLQGGAGTLSAQGSITSPGALAVIAATSALPVGRYRVTAEISLAGTLAQGTDNDNLQVAVTGGGQVVRLNNSIAAGVQTFGPLDLEITAATGTTIEVQVVGAGSVGAIYTAGLQDAQDAQGTITDGGQVLGTFGVPAGSTDTEWFGEHGVYVGTDVQVHITQGDASGVVYVCPYEDY